MSEIDQQFIEYVVKSLVGKPNAVQVERRIDEKGVLLELTVDPEDLGRVIGKRGATAQSLRTLLRALGTKNDARYNLKIIDNGEGPHAPSSSSAAATSAPADASDDSSPSVPAPTPTTTQDDQVAVDEPEPAKDNEEDQAGERIRQAREELADLDDLDV